MTISSELFTEELRKFNIELNDIAVNRFDKYAEMIIEWNKKFNLTAITNPDDIVIKHFTDSLSILSYLNFEKNQSLIDVGTGAGFPGIPLLIANPDINVTFLDSTGKKISFIENVLSELDLKGNTIIGRAEETANKKEYRESFDFCTARAVANLRELSECCLPFVKVNGTFISMKSAKTDEEIKDAKNAIDILGGEIEKVKSFELSDCGERTLIFIKKSRLTPTKYPRNYSQIMKKPLK